MGENDDFPQLETDRLIVRQITLDDTEAVLQQQNMRCHNFFIVGERLAGMRA